MRTVMLLVLISAVCAVLTAFRFVGGDVETAYVCLFGSVLTGVGAAALGPNEIQKKMKQAFTLIEMLVVIAIIAILAGLLMPAISRAMQQARAGAVASFISQVDVAITAYRNDHGNVPPDNYIDLFQRVKYDLNGDGVYDPGTVALPGPDWVAWGAAYPGSQGEVNEGAECLFLSLMTANGGPYIESNPTVIGNTDSDTDGTGIAHEASSAIGPADLFEFVDSWGNPLVYIASREYDLHDGRDPTDPTIMDPAEPTLLYAAGEENPASPSFRVRARGPIPPMWTHPNLTSAQVFSLGIAGVKNTKNPVTGNFILDPDWKPGARFITNWQE